MPSENSTLERIQREISEEIQREKEIKRLHEQYYSYNNNNNNNVSTDSESNCGSVNGDARSEDFNLPGPLSRAQSASSLLLNGDSIVKQTNGTSPLPQNGIKTNNTNQKQSTVAVKYRIFTPNPQTKGMMHRFIKSRGKLNVVNAINSNGNAILHKDTTDLSNNNNNNNGIANRKSWVLPEFIEPTKVTIDPSKCVRKGFVPVEVRMRKEFQEMHVRELELRKERRKSQGDYYSLCDEDEDRNSSPEVPLRAAKSMAQLYNPEDYSDAGDYSNPSAPNSLKTARSLAELCDVEDDAELLTPSTLISKFETIIKKNQPKV